MKNSRFFTRPFFYLLTIYTLYIQSFWDITVDVKVQKLHNLS